MKPFRIGSIVTIVLLLVGLLVFQSSKPSPEKNKPEKENVTTVKTNSEVITPAAPVIVKNEKVYNPDLLPYLKTITAKLEEGNYHKWTDYTSCNVGLFAQLITKKSAKEVEQSVVQNYKDYIEHETDETGTSMQWQRMINYYCGVTGKPIKGIIGELQKAGFRSIDISNLEHLSDPKILQDSGIEQGAAYYTQKENVILYLKSWIRYIENQKS